VSLDFDTCSECFEYIIEGTLRTNRTLSSMCRCKRDDEGVLIPCKVVQLPNGMHRSIPDEGLAA
jgi:hypothetical protein